MAARVDHKRLAPRAATTADACAIDYGATGAHSTAVALAHQAALRTGGRAVPPRTDYAVGVRTGTLAVTAQDVAITRTCAAIRVRGTGVLANARAITKAAARLAAVALGV